MTKHRFIIELEIPDGLYEEERRIHAAGSAPLPDHPSECSWRDLAWLAERTQAKVAITDYTQIGAPS